MDIDTPEINHSKAQPKPSASKLFTPSDTSK